MSERTENRTVLDPERQSLLLPLAVSIAAHVGVAVTAFVITVIAGYLAPKKPVIDVDRTMSVSMVSLPKSKSNMPERASRTPDQAAGTATPDAPTPVRESDLAFQTDTPEPVKGDPNADKKREEMLAEFKRQQMLEDLSAPIGTTNRSASDPNGTGDFAMSGTVGDVNDPEYARYIRQIQQLFMQHFQPLASIAQANPDIVCTVQIQVDPATGQVTSYEITKGSGNASYDSAAERATQAVPKIPLPPAKYVGLLSQGYEVNFRPPNR